MIKNIINPMAANPISNPVATGSPLHPMSMPERRAISTKESERMKNLGLGKSHTLLVSIRLKWVAV